MTLTWELHRPSPPRNDCIESALPGDAREPRWRLLQERRLSALQAAFARHGGYAGADQLCGLLRAHWEQPLSRVARWIAQREVVSVSWQTQVWIPMFQFERPSFDLVPCANHLVRALRSVYDEWELAEWFVRPHDLLAGRLPVVLLDCDPGAVKEAARLDHFINRW